ncbi:MAG TPA: WD40 repeat domain-containing protein [Isosphaeraceae bacterium]|nr:WD40 repeat domain-containing protein [Isosphaeraceae bacterium]
MADPFCRRPPPGDGKLVATGSADQVVRFWDASTGRELERLSAHQGAITGVAILPDNASVVSSAADGAIRVWKPAAVRIFTGHEGPTHAVVAHPIGSQVTTGSADKSAKVFDLNNGNLIRSLAGHSDAVRAVVVSGDGTRVVTVGNDRTVRFWNAGDGNNVLVLPGLPAPALSLAASSDSKLAAAGLELEDGSTRVSDLTATDAAKTELQTFTPGAGAGPIAAVAFLAEPLALLTGGGDRSLKLWTVIAPGAGSPGRTSTLLPSAAFQKRTVRSLPAVTTLVPSPEATTARTASVWPVIVRITVPAFKSKTLTDLSAEPVMT